MKLVILAPALLSSAAFFVASCTPYPEVPPTPGPDVAMNNPNAQNPDGTTDKPPGEETTADATGTGSTGREEITEKIEDPGLPDRTSTKPTTKVARPVPGKPGFVFSPFNNKIIDVKGIPSGTLVADPTYPAAEKMYFRVP